MIQSISRVCLCIWRGDHERNISDTRHHPETHGPRPRPHPALVLWPRNSDAAWCAMGNCIGVSWPWCCIQVNSWWIESEEISNMKSTFYNFPQPLSSVRLSWPLLIEAARTLVGMSDQTVIMKTNATSWVFMPWIRGTGLLFREFMKVWKQSYYQ